MENSDLNISIKKYNYEKKKRKFKEIKFNYNKLFYFKNFSIRKKKFFIIFIIIIYLHINKMILSNDNNNNYYKIRGFTNLKQKKIVKKSTNSTLNKGFLEINTTHKGKFAYYDYNSNIKIYKDLYKDISYTPITNSNFILNQIKYQKKNFQNYVKKVYY